MKRAFNQYHINMRKDYSSKRADIMKEEQDKRIEALSLVKQL